MEERRHELLDGVGLVEIVTNLVETYGWEGLDQEFEYRCFYVKPSIKSTVKFLKANDWARKDIDRFYVKYLKIMKIREDLSN